MPFISPNEAFRGYTNAIIVGIYSDMITASAVKKENKSAVVIATAQEPMESVGIVNGPVPVEKIMFNMEKAIMALPHDVRTSGSAVIVALGPGAGTCTYLTVNGKRETRERKITAEEVAIIMAAANTEKGNDTVLKNYAEQFLIDGFSVSDPVGINGGEVSIGMVRVACDGAFEKECAARVTGLGLKYGGMIDMRYAAMHADHFFTTAPHALLIFIFEHETHIALMREKAVHGVGTAGAGYGILYAEVARAFSVGMEEAKEIVHAYRKQELNESTKGIVENVCTAAAKKMVDTVKDTIIGIDSANIIPGKIHIAGAYAVPEISMQFVAGEWFKDIPIERNVSVSLFPEEKSKGFATPFDFMSFDFLTRHH